MKRKLCLLLALTLSLSALPLVTVPAKISAQNTAKQPIKLDEGCWLYNGYVAIEDPAPDTYTSFESFVKKVTDARKKALSMQEKTAAPAISPLYVRENIEQYSPVLGYNTFF